MTTGPTSGGPTVGTSIALPQPVLTAAAMKPGEIVWIDMPEKHVVGSEQKKRRPWVIVSSERFNQSGLGLVKAVPLTSKVHKKAQFPVFRVLVLGKDVTYQDQQLPQDVQLARIDRCALTEHLKSLSEKRILARPGKVTQRVVDLIRNGAAHILEI